MNTLGALKVATGAARAAVAQRDDLIRQAHTEGATLRAIAAVCGLSHQRVHQIIHRR